MSKNAFSEAEKARMRGLAALGRNSPAIADELGRSRHSVHAWLQDNVETHGPNQARDFAEQDAAFCGAMRAAVEAGLERP